MTESRTLKAEIRVLHTTGRVATRMSDEERAELQQRLAPFTPTADYLKNPPSPLEVELGIGNGLALLARAVENPNWHFLGCELYLNGLRTLLNHLEKSPDSPRVKGHGLRVTNLDARPLLESLKPGSIHRLGVYFPDPWPKAKHHKRRLIQQDFLTLAAKAMAPGAELWVVTDWPDYAFHTMSQLYTHPHFTLNQSEEAAPRCKTRPDTPPEAEDEESLTSRPSPIALGPHHLSTPPEWWVPTKYQQKAEQLGRKPWFILARRKS